MAGNEVMTSDNVSSSTAMSVACGAHSIEAMPSSSVTAAAAAAAAAEAATAAAGRPFAIVPGFAVVPAHAEISFEVTFIPTSLGERR